MSVITGAAQDIPVAPIGLRTSGFEGLGGCCESIWVGCWSCGGNTCPGWNPARCGIGGNLSIMYFLIAKRDTGWANENKYLVARQGLNGLQNLGGQPELRRGLDRRPHFNLKSDR